MLCTHFPKLNTCKSVSPFSIAIKRNIFIDNLYLHYSELAGVVDLCGVDDRDCLPS